MGSRRRGVREGIPNVNYEREQETFMTTMNAVAEAVCKAAVAAARAVDRLGHVPEGQHVEFATYMLEGEAEHWWKGVQRLLQQDEGDIPWNTFKDEFYKKYFPRAARDAKEMELVQLKQGDMTIAKYARNFDDLCYFSKICQGDPADLEEWKCLKFEGGLCVDLMSSIVSLEIRNFAELVNKSKLVEECIKKVTVAKVSRQGFPPRNYNSYSWQPRRINFKTPGVPQRRNPQAGNAPARPTSGNGGKVRQEHDNRSCQFGSPNCYACRELGHIAKDCPKGFTRNPVSTQQQGRVFAITINDVVESNTLIQGQVMSRIDF
ncbi:uncharacterized protein LOC110281537 [Arachis duranensis]|uniref:Uncharacterized protein LOC110281537 n=1 Tax=Arachis duranensis TaxID=130453 RepID=A0A6P5NTF8_ARADU|nr:uncharacterized protein LOC110281537 [Arachis duranensis]